MVWTETKDLGHVTSQKELAKEKKSMILLNLGSFKEEGSKLSDLSKKKSLDELKHLSNALDNHQIDSIPKPEYLISVDYGGMSGYGTSLVASMVGSYGQERSSVDLVSGTVAQVNSEQQNSMDTEVFIWGNGDNYQLGAGNQHDQKLHGRVDSLHWKTVVSISAEKYWASTITSTSEVYMWDGKKGKDMPPSLSHLHSLKRATKVAVGETQLLVVGSLYHPTYPPTVLKKFQTVQADYGMHFGPPSFENPRNSSRNLHNIIYHKTPCHEEGVYANRTRLIFDTGWKHGSCLFRNGFQSHESIKLLDNDELMRLEVRSRSWGQNRISMVSRVPEYVDLGLGSDGCKRLELGGVITKPVDDSWLEKETDYGEEKHPLPIDVFHLYSLFGSAGPFMVLESTTNAKGWTEKGAHKNGRLNEQSWLEKWENIMTEEDLFSNGQTNGLRQSWEPNGETSGKRNFSVGSLLLLVWFVLVR